VVAMSEGLALQLKPHGIGVSVVCPSYVRTRIGESGRNRLSRYGEAPRLDPASPAGLMVADISKRLESGLEAQDVAARVVAAIQDDELYVFTHPNMREEVDDRFAAIQAAMDRVAG
jgi:NAD(P)-dependent dehydrogenase (short-subunit alcohol dehydrogenase family)